MLEDKVQKLSDYLFCFSIGCYVWIKEVEMVDYWTN